MSRRAVVVVVASALLLWGSVAPATAVGIVDDTAVGDLPLGVALSPDGSTAYVIDYDPTISVIATESMSLVDELPSPGVPTGIAISPNGATLAVISSITDTVSLIRASDGLVLETIAVDDPQGVVFSGDGTRAYVTSSAQTLVVINVTTESIQKTVALKMADNTPIFPVGLTISGNTVWIAGTSPSALIKFSTTTNTVSAVYPMGANPVAVDVSNDGSTVYLVNYNGTQEVDAVQASTGNVLDSVAVGTNPGDIAVAAGGDFAYVTSESGSSYSIIDLSTFETINTTVIANGVYGVETGSDGGIYIVQDDWDTLLKIGFTSDRISGPDRFSTAVEISQAAFPGEAPIAFIATGLNYPDALAAGPAAAHLGGPLLLTAPTSLPAVVKAELIRLNPDKIVVLGSTAAVSASVQAQLASIAPVSRWQGPDRYATGLAIVDKAFSSATRAFIATGQNFPDALAAGAGGAYLDAPIILVNGLASSVTPQTIALLDDLGVTDVTIVGGTPAVSQAIQNQLAALYTVERVSGPDRFATSAAINSSLYTDRQIALLATGLNFPDALAGAALSAATGVPLYVTSQSCVPQSVIVGLNTLGIAHVTLLGGTPALSTAVEDLTRC
jgi:putative cell wall-binding protein/DNA-binding beta-propeller fold protein YncE